MQAAGSRAQPHITRNPAWPQGLTCTISGEKIQGMGEPTGMKSSIHSTRMSFRARWAKPLVCLGVHKTLPAARLQVCQARHCGLRAPELGWGSAELGSGVLSLAASPWIAVTAPASLSTQQSFPKLCFTAGWAPGPGVSILAGSSPAGRNQDLAMAMQTPCHQ